MSEPSRPAQTARRWREILQDPAQMAAQFPSLAESLAIPARRRQVLKLMAASLALGGLTGCDSGAADGHLIPAAIAPPGIVPGRPDFYSTAALEQGVATGIIVTHTMGRPIKVEGNPLHPASLGATDATAQALILDFYDPDRAAALLNQGEPSTTQALLATLLTVRERAAATRGRGLRILTGGVTSPTLGAMIDAILAQYPEARWHQWEAHGRDAVRAGTQLAYGRPLDLLAHVDRAEVILALDSDLLLGAPGHVRMARDFAGRRNPTRGAMSRVYAVEPAPTLIGVAGDHRFVAGPGEMHAAVTALAAGLLHGETPSGAPPWIAPVIADLRAHHGRALVHAGPALPAETQALVLAMNEALGARGTVLDLIAPVAYRPVEYAADLAGLIADMQAGEVETLLILDSNPVFTAPGFAEAMARVKLSIASAPSLDETGQAASWFVPQTQLFESWGDARAYDGTASVLQPQSLPLFDGASPIELLSLLRDAAAVAPIDAVRATWLGRLGGDAGWRDALAAGVIPQTASAPVQDALRPAAAAAMPPTPPAQALHLLLRPDPHLGDGRHANNPWLQELPRPLIKLVWDNPLLIAPSLARGMSLDNGSEVMLTIDGRKLALPVWINPGQAEDVIVALTGYGRTVAGEVGAGTGWDVWPLRGAAGTLELVKTGRRIPLASTDHHDPLGADSSEIVRRGTLAQFEANPGFLKGSPGGEYLYRNPPKSEVAWAMSVDLNACIGCNACVVACMAENNVPVVGKTAVMHEREMHWLRIDRYYDGATDHPDAYFQPMLCQHCEEAPCEVVCPFGATVHDQEGINVMIYNRCAGTRFCSNNCPYKVRRFNYGPYVEDEHRPPEARNPNVTARARGVMEKCTFCLQRIAEARVAHDRDGVPERVVTACQAACPTEVFTFGDVNDPHSAVRARKMSPLDYVLLPEQNTHPRLTYEGRIRNLNPEIET